MGVTCRMEGDWKVVQPAIVHTRLVLNIRNAYRLVDSKSELQSETFEFGGSIYCVTIGASERFAGTKNYGWRVGIRMKKCGPTQFDTDNFGLSSFIR